MGQRPPTLVTYFTHSGLPLDAGAEATARRSRLELELPSGPAALREGTRRWPEPGAGGGGEPEELVRNLASVGVVGERETRCSSAAIEGRSIKACPGDRAVPLPPPALLNQCCIDASKCTNRKDSPPVPPAEEGEEEAEAAAGESGPSAVKSFVTPLSEPTKPGASNARYTVLLLAARCVARSRLCSARKFSLM